MHPEKYLKQLIEPLFQTKRTKEISKYNPVATAERLDAEVVKLSTFHYDTTTIEKEEVGNVEETFKYNGTEKVTWLNIDGIARGTVEKVSAHFKIHPLIVEDIISIGQRPKMDDIDGRLYCLLNMLYFNEQHCTVEQEQISIVLGNNFIITFQEDASRDVFDGVRHKLQLSNSKLRAKGADYLFYTLIDMIVDHYFGVIESLGEKIEGLEEEIIRSTTKRSLAKINSLRKELLFLKRNVVPVRELMNGFIRSDSELLDDEINKYFKDVYDHILQANEVVENYRDIMSSLQDLYISQVNLKMNEVMKVMAIVTCLLAPATVIGGIFGMNFDVIPISHQIWGFYLTVGTMLLIGVVMMIIFKKRGWF